MGGGQVWGKKEDCYVFSKVSPLLFSIKKLHMVNKLIISPRGKKKDLL